MGLDKRFTYLNPGNTMEPDSNNLQRYLSQPTVGCFCYGFNEAVVVNTPGVWSQLGFPTANVVTVDPLNMFNKPASRVVYKETGIYFVSLNTFADGGVNTPGEYHISFNTDLIAAPNGADGVTHPLYNFTREYVGAGVMVGLSGYLFIRQSTLGALANSFWLLAFGPAAKNWRVTKFETMLVSKTLPGKY